MALHTLVVFIINFSYCSQTVCARLNTCINTLYCPPLRRSLSATTLSFAAIDSRTELFDSLTSADSHLFLFTLSRLPLTRSSHDTLPDGLGGRGGPVLRLAVC